MATAWGTQLEDIIVKLRERGKVTPAYSGEMLRNKYWTGLRSERLKNATRHKFDVPGSFLDLLAHVRAVEHEFKEAERVKGSNKTKTAKIHQATPKEDPPVVDVAAIASSAAIAAVQPILERMAALMENHGVQRGSWQEERPRGNLTDGCFRCGGLDHFARGCRAVLPGSSTNRPETGNGAAPLPGSGQ